jgi:hypothetical protein
MGNVKFKPIAYEQATLDVLRIILYNDWPSDTCSLDTFCRAYLYASTLDILVEDNARHSWNLEHCVALYRNYST